MLVEAIFWFHPLVWWIGARLVVERERACDEDVLRLGSEPHVYAEAILNVCKHYLESPLVCVSGITGSDLKKRINAIIARHIAQKLNVTRKLLLVAGGIAAIAIPIAIGFVSAPASRAQSTEKGPGFELASIKPSNSADRRPVMKIRRGLLVAQETTMAWFASQLSEFLARPVVDKTGLTGKYDLKLEWQPDENQVAMFQAMQVPEGLGAPPADPAGPSYSLPCRSNSD
jgi:hypothetical protein